MEYRSAGWIRRYNPQTRIPRARLPLDRWVKVREHFAVETEDGLILFGVTHPTSKGLKTWLLCWNGETVSIKA